MVWTPMMPRLSHSDYKRLLDFIAALQEPVDAGSFGGNLLNLVAPLLPDAILAFDQINTRSDDYLFDHGGPIDAAEIAPYFERLQQVYQQNPIYDYIQSGGTGPVVRLSELASRRVFHRTEFYQDIFRPLGLEYQLTVLIPRDGWITTLTLNRDRDIPQRLVDFFHLAARHIALAHRTAHLLSTTRSAVNGAPPEALTPREKDVFQWLQEGKRNSEIAVILGCASRTIDKHVEHILRKTSAETRTAAVRSRPER